jgi:hypothetical protein
LTKPPLGLCPKQLEIEFKQVAHDLDAAVNQLNLVELVRSSEQVEKDYMEMREEVATSFRVIESVMENLFNEQMDTNRKIEVLSRKFDSIHEIFAAVSETRQKASAASSNYLTNTSIDPQHIHDVPDGIVCGRVRKKLYIAQTVAQIKVGSMRHGKECTHDLERHIAILSELKDCQYIIRL